MMDFLCEISYTRVRPTCCILLYDPQLVVETQSRGGGEWLQSGYNVVNHGKISNEHTFRRTL